MAGSELKLKFNNPASDSRTPDIIVQPVYGTIYTASKKKNAEHGGFSFGDTNVGLIVSNPELHASVVKTPVATSQVAPTILEALGLNPQALKSVKVCLACLSRLKSNPDFSGVVRTGSAKLPVFAEAA